MAESPDPRLAAVRALNRVLPGQGDGASLREVLRRGVPDGSAGGLTRDLCFGVCRYLRPLNQWLNDQLDKPIKAKAQPVRLALLCGLYELWFTERPQHAVVNAYPELCRRLKAGWASGLTNALLRKASRLDAATAFAGYPPAVASSLPDWLWRQFQEDWPEQADDMARASLTPPPFTLRVNRRRHDRDQARAALGEGARPSELAPWSLYLTPPRPVTALPGFDTGAFSVQDEAAQLPAECLAVPPGGRVLDACAAPGGKTGQILEAFPDARVVALDQVPARLERVRETLARLGVDAEPRVGDAAEPSQWWDGEPFDAILLDAPCSATGILRRQPDVKWHRRRADLPPLVDLQARMLDALWPLLRPGGRLVYATCSVLREENDRQVAAFLARTPDAADLTERPPAAPAVEAGWQLLPRENGPDGFYLACLRKHEAPGPDEQEGDR
ncbi:16S rRNA (cytosine(967)-C(5))-methyltransferase RsmB [Alloalcanivorax marinus]|uniref:16S rRNA (cytosine(967)-C(5))-methyltransferase RsmB n=1 Tax=Alloalcanivorax marinus TaxID=1177169 RepID=UPI0019329ED0|nr:16S rRNA (cytosine(967)-C(5))-methyltransferase RsmB [Alloalcanivorax marinus]MBL7251973.1 16S rRNA (cytosine(967)-C(5))-methyltransferase RsmB [Alloalcanivorax marinus]